MEVRRGRSECMAREPAPFYMNSCPPPALSRLQGTSALGEEHAGLTQSFKNISPPTESLIHQPSSQPCVTVVAVNLYDGDMRVQGRHKGSYLAGRRIQSIKVPRHEL